MQNPQIKLSAGEMQLGLQVHAAIKIAPSN
jgi:hypothetical protein